MTPRKTCEWIIEHMGCQSRGRYDSEFEENCPLLEGEFACEKFENQVLAAQAWLEKNGEATK